MKTKRAQMPYVMDDDTLFFRTVEEHYGEWEPYIKRLIEEEIERDEAPGQRIARRELARLEAIEDCNLPNHLVRAGFRVGLQMMRAMMGGAK